MKSPINILIVIMAIIISSCNTETSRDSNITQTLIPNILSPVQLNTGENIISLTDFFPDETKIDSVEIIGKPEFSFNNEDKTLKIIASIDQPWLTELRIFASGEPYSVLLQKSRKVNKEITFDPYNKIYSKVQLAGSINDWNPESTNLILSDGKWKCTLNLNPGKYHYQLVVDGNWILDPANDSIEDNNLGGFNSVLIVGDASKDLSPFINIKELSENEFLVENDKPYSEIFVMWQNYRLQPLSDTGHIYNIPSSSKKIKRSWLTVRTYNSYGIGNDLLVPLEYGNIVKSMDQTDRFDKETSILYFMMLDRFNNGNKSNDFKVDDPEVSPKANYFGGDIAGVYKKLKDGYFDSLGINTIWLSPITQNTWGAFREYPEPHRKFTGYHGYWPITLSTIDTRFGTEKELQDLVNEAHSRDINIILDFVSNHVHQECKLIKDHPDWATEVNLPDGTKNIRLWDSHRLTTWFDTFLPTWNLELPQVADYVSDSALFWIKKYDLDGFRHDATKHIPQKYWSTLTKKLKNQVIVPDKKRLLQIGETFGSRELIGSYVGSGMLDGQFDFNLFFDARSVFAVDNVSFKKLSKSLKESFAYYGHHHLMGNISGNHDMARFISYAGGALSFDEESQAAGWNRDIKVENPVGYKKLLMLTAFNMTIPGIPVIYYGDEYGMPGAGDPDNRRQMQFSNLSENEQRTRETTEKLVELRRNNIALNFGTYKELFVDDNTFVYCRQYFDNIVIIAMNKSSKPTTVLINNEFGVQQFINYFNGSIKYNKKAITIDIPALSFEIIESK